MKKAVLLIIAMGLVVFGSGAVLAQGPPGGPKCSVSNTLTADPGWSVATGTLVTLTQEVKNTTAVTPNQCGLAAGAYANDGARMAIEAVTLGANGPGMTCDDLAQSRRYCTAGAIGNSCVVNSDCDTPSGSGNGVCTAVTTTPRAVEGTGNTPPIDGVVTFNPDTSQPGAFGFRAVYNGGQNFNNGDTVCSDLTVSESCTGATITVERTAGNGAPPAGTTGTWDFDVVVRACEPLYNVSAQGGTNGWAPLKSRFPASFSADTGSASIRNANKKAEVILWNIGNMIQGQTARLRVTLEGSIPAKTPDCQLRYLSGAWSALFSTDGLNVQKTDYTGRVSVQVDSNGDGNPPGTCP